MILIKSKALEKNLFKLKKKITSHTQSQGDETVDMFLNILKYLKKNHMIRK